MSLIKSFNKLQIQTLPKILLDIQKLLIISDIKISNKLDDGRNNSVIDEKTIIDILMKSKFKNNIKLPKKRMWYDLLIDNMPVNIKSTTTFTCDNVGNLSLCVQAFTDYDLDYDKYYKNDVLSNILYSKIKNKEYNNNFLKDYYFIVIDKNDTQNIIVNSILGISKFRSNLSNLPFQVKWCENKEYKYTPIKLQINKFILCVQKPKQNWKEIFLQNIRTSQI